VEAGLLELFFDIDFAGILEGDEPGAHPADLLAGEAAFGDVDSGAGEVGADDVSLGGGGVAVHLDQALLVLDGANGGADLKGAVELDGVGAGQVGEEASGPGAAVAVMLGQVAVNG
jgi:hypothetical protein